MTRIVTLFCSLLWGVAVVTGLVAEPKTLVNPITDPCWQCMFPIHIGGMNVTPSQKDFVEYKKQWWQMFCGCSLTHWGVKLAFWETQSVIEVTKTPYQLLTWNGVSLGTAKGYEKRGTVANIGIDGCRSSFYNVHQYAFPMVRILGMIPGFTCLRDFDISVPLFLSEWDPAWNDMSSSLHTILNPERFAQMSVAAQQMCIEDCQASNRRKPTDIYPWCAGCLGALYPYSGHVSHHVGAIQASSLLLCRWLALNHAVGKFFPEKWNVFGIGQGFAPDNFCHKQNFPFLKKTMYKTQLIYPIADTKGQKDASGVYTYCHPLGATDASWGAGYTYPEKGEDFAYLVWTKRQCCLDAVDVFMKALKVLEDKKVINTEDADKVRKYKELLEAMEKMAL